MKTTLRNLTERLNTLVSSRPLGIGCLFFMLCCAALLFSPTGVKIALFAAGLLCGAALIFLKNKTFFARFHLIRCVVCLFLAALSCLCCFVCYDLFDKRLEESARAGERVTIVCYPDEIVYESDYSSLYKASVTRIDGKGVYGVKTLIATERTELKLFEYYSLSGVPSFPAGSTPYFDAASYYRAQGIFTVFEEGDASVDLYDSAGGPQKLFSDMRSAIENRFHAFTDEDTAGLLAALLLGRRTDLSSALKRDFKAFGISHLLAISGLHLSVLFFLVDLLLRKLRARKKLRTAIEMLFILSYMTLCSFAPSVTRAGIMLLLYLTAELFDRQSDSYTSLFLAGALMTFISPVCLFNTGFLLSFFATFGILVSGKVLQAARFSQKHKVLSKLLVPLVVSLFAQTAVLPVLLFTYGSVSLLTPLSTLVFTPLISLLLFLAPVCLLFSLIPVLAPVASAIITLPCNFTAFLASFARYFREFHMSVPTVIAILLCVSIGVFVFLFFVLRKKRIGAAVLLSCYLCLSVVCFVLPRTANARIITDLNGKNDVVLTYGKGKSTVVDLSDGSNKHLELCLGLLGEQTGELYLDTLVLTHYHQRHIATFEKFMGKNYLDTLCLPAPCEDDMEIYRSLVDKAEKYGVRVLEYDGDAEVDLGGGISLSGCCKDYIKRSTHPVFTFVLSYGEKSVRFLSSSSWEKITQAEEQTLYFTLHGPVAKSAPDKSLTDGKTLLCPDEELCKKLFGEDAECIAALPFVYRFD